MANTEEMIWFMNDGRELIGEDALKYLTSRMPVLLQVLDSARVLNEHIRSELDHYEPTGNIVNDTLDLCETLSHIEIYCESFLSEYYRMKQNLS